MAKWLLLGAIVAEVIATSALKASEQFTRPLASTLVVVGYGISFYLLAMVVREIPVGIAYAVWSGLGIVLISAVAALLYRQLPDLPALLGMGLIIAGVAVINLYSRTATH